MYRSLFSVLLLILGGSLSSAAAAQINILDRGEFEVSIGGTLVGTETFSIRQTGTEADTRIIAAGQIRTTPGAGPGTMNVLMELTGSQWTPSVYQNKVEGVQAQQIGFELRGARFESRVTSGLGEQVKEYRALPGTVILERGVAHHFFFLGAHAGLQPADVPVIVPRDGSQLQGRLTTGGTEDILVGGKRIPARRYRVTAGDASWDAWYDDRHRVLRISEESSGYTAVRVAPPGP